VTQGELSKEVAAVLPWTAVGALLAASFTLYFATPFQIARRNELMLFVIAPAAAVNLLANFVLLPLFPIVAAGWSMVVGYLAAILLSLRVGNQLFPMPFPFSDACRTALACVPLAAFLQFDFQQSAFGFTLMFGGAALVYVSGAVALNVVNSRGYLLMFLQNVVRKSRA
jgi:O-antigen/teichoic acid export membrane protein